MSAYPDTMSAELVLEAGVGPLDSAADPETHALGINMAGRTAGPSRSNSSLNSLSRRGLVLMIGTWPFKWTKSADDILAAVKRFCLRVDQHLCHEL